jgi:helicase
MGFEHEHGRVIFTASQGFQDRRAVSAYLQPDVITPLVPRIAPMAFAQIALQLVSAGICRSEAAAAEFILAGR